MLGSLLTIALVVLADLVAASSSLEGNLPYAISSRTSSLIRAKGAAPESSRQLAAEISNATGQSELYSVFMDLQFVTNLTVGGYDLLVIVDTGSSDTWVVDSNYTCYNVTTNQEVPQADCGLVATYSPGSTFEQIPNANLNITYADLEYLNGVFGYETLELAGLEITHQQIGVPYRAGWDGTNISSGLMGLAYPAITSEYVGTNVSADNRSDPNSAKEYSPIINTIFFVENLTEPVFSIALCRNPSTFGFGGSLTIGGIPDITDATVNASDVFATVPIEPFALSRTKNFTFYAITVDELVYFEEGYGSYNVQMIVDSGTTFDYFPTEDADAINSLFYPPAQFDEYLGLYVVPCDAIPPEVGVSIGGQTFFHNPDDLIADVGLGDGLCATAISDGGAIAGGDGTYVLGDTFMKNVLAVFDVGKSQMSFSSRMYYEGADDQ